MQKNMDLLTEAIEHFSQIKKLLLSLRDEVHIEKKHREKLIKHTQLMTKNLQNAGIYEQLKPKIQKMWILAIAPPSSLKNHMLDKNLQEIQEALIL